MEIFRSRPLALAVCVMVAASFFAFSLSPTLKLILLAVALAVGMALSVSCFFQKKIGKRGAIALLCAAGIALALTGSWLFFNVEAEPLQSTTGESVVAEGYVEERLSMASYESRFRVSLDSVGSDRTHVRAILKCEYLSALQAGDRFRVTASSVPFDDPDHGEDPNSCYADGITGILVCESVEDCSIFQEPRSSVFLSLTRWNHRLSTRLSERIGGRAGALASAFLLGNRGRLSQDDVLHFRRAGISHLLALSGLHVSILVAAVEWLLRRFRLPRTVRSVVVAILAVGYLAVTGFAPSTTRTVIMVCLLYASVLFRENYDPFTALCSALFLIVATSPGAIFDLSMWMSFIAAGAIIVYVPATRDLFSANGRLSFFPRWVLGFLRTVVGAVVVGLFANCAILPLSAAFFGETSLASVPATVLLSPLMTLALILSALALILPPFPALLSLTSFVLNTILSVAEWISDRQGWMVILRDRTTGVLLVLLVIALIVTAILRLRRKIWLGVPILLSAAVLLSGVCAIPSEKADLSVSYFHAAERELLLFSRGGHSVAVDFSDGTSNVRSTLSKAVQTDFCTEIDDLILTHYHSTATYLISELSSGIKVRRIRLPVPANDTERALAARMREEAELHGVEVLTGTEELAVPGLRVVLSERSCKHDGGEASLLFSVETDSERLTYLSASAPTTGLKELLPVLLLDSDVVIVGSHGASDRTAEPFNLLSEIAPRYVLFADEEIQRDFLLTGTSVAVGLPSDRFSMK